VKGAEMKSHKLCQGNHCQKKPTRWGTSKDEFLIPLCELHYEIHIENEEYKRTHATEIRLMKLADKILPAVGLGIMSLMLIFMIWFGVCISALSS
jgi:hypothetical protein